MVPDDEFTSVLFPLFVAARERGAAIRTVPFERLADSVGDSTGLVAFSLIQSQSGRAADLAAITAAAKRVGARVLVDATHAVPFVPFDSPVDYLVCAAYKHLLSPRGVAFLHVRKQLWDSVPPLFANWRSASTPYGHYYGGAARYRTECGALRCVACVVRLGRRSCIARAAVSLAGGWLP